MDILDAHGIRHIVNCMEGGEAKNFHEENPEFHYLSFLISDGFRDTKEAERKLLVKRLVEAKKAKANGTAPAERAETADGDEAVIEYFDRLFAWGDPVLAEGQNILVHCLAGAHRAGTTGLVYLMHLEKLRLKDALPLAQGRRRQIDPIGTLKELAERYDEALGRS